MADNQNLWEQLTPIVKMVSFTIGLTIIAPALLNKMSSVADSQLQFSYSFYNLAGKHWSFINKKISNL